MFNAPTLNAPASLQGLDGIATLGSLAALPAAFTANLTARFGRITRSYPAPAFAAAVAGFGVPVAGVLRRDGLVAGVARALALVLSRLARAIEQGGRRWALARERRRTEIALSGLDARTLSDIGFARSEISSVASEAAGEIEATRQRVWCEIGHRVI